MVKLGTLACKLSVYLSSVKASKLSKVFTKLELLGNIIVLMQAFFFEGGGGLGELIGNKLSIHLRFKSIIQFLIFDGVFKITTKKKS